MSNPLTAADGGVNAVELLTGLDSDPNPNVVLLVGDQNDFTWELQASTDAGANYTAMTDANGDTSFTGAVPKEFIAAANTLYRVEITALGTATSIDLRTN